MSRVNAAVISTVMNSDILDSKYNIGLVLLLPLPLESLAVLTQVKINLGGLRSAVGAAFKGELTALPHNFVVGKYFPRKNICNINKMTQTLFMRNVEQMSIKVFQIPTSPTDWLVTWFAKTPEKKNRQTINRQTNEHKQSGNNGQKCQLKCTYRQTR